MVIRGEELVNDYDELVIGEGGVGDRSRRNWLKERTNLRPELCGFENIKKFFEMKPEAISA